MSEAEIAFHVLPAEFVGHAQIHDGILDVGGVRVPVAGMIGPEGTRTLGVYVRRYSNDLQVAEVHLADHDGLAQEELDSENDEAERYPLGPREYWRSKLVGKVTCGADEHLMTDEDFDEEYDG